MPRKPTTKPAAQQNPPAGVAVSIEPKVVDHPTAAKLLGISPRALGSLVAGKHIAQLKTPLKKRLYLVTELNRYIAECQAKS